MLSAPSLAATLLITLFAVPPAPSSTESFCSVRTEDGEPYRPTVEGTTALVHRAELIVRAVVRDAPEAEGSQSSRYAQNIEFEVLEVLKGHLSSDALQIRGRLVAVDDFNRGEVPYLWNRSGVDPGGCYATSYRLGGEYLLLLRESGGHWTPYWSFLSPVNEQISGAADPWVQWVRQQL